MTSPHEVTPQMIEAGLEVLKEHFYDLWETRPRDELSRFVAALYSAMAETGPKAGQ